MSETSPTLVVCTCISFKCRLASFVNQYGVFQPGKEIRSQLRSKHRARDYELAVSAELEPVPSLAEVNESEDRDMDVNRDLLEDNHDDSLTHSRKVLVTFVCTIVVWLHLRCGLSRANADRLMKAIHILISLAINFGRLLVKFQYPDVALRPLPTPPIPHDVRTAIATLSLDPKIIRSICCPKCYSKYSLNHLPEICGRRETARSQPCGAKLWTTRSTRSGPRRVPCRLYSTQDFDSWLEFFLSRPGIEDLIDKSYDHNPSPNIMRTIIPTPRLVACSKGL